MLTTFPAALYDCHGLTLDFDLVHTVPDPYGYIIYGYGEKNSFKRCVALKFTIRLENVMTTNHRILFQQTTS